MRISNQMLQYDALRNMRNRLEELARAQDQAATGQRVSTMSDQPTGAVQILQLEGRLRDIDQYRRNSASATTKLSAEDAVLTRIRDLLQRAKSLALIGATADPNDPLRVQALAEVQQINQEVVALGNTRVGDEYIFGGARTDTPPFLADGTYTGDTIMRQASIDEEVTVPVNHTGDQMISSALSSLNGLAQELQSGTGATIAGMIPTLAFSEDQALTAQAEVGSRLREIQTTGEDLLKRSALLGDQRDQIQNVDPAEASVNVLSAQSALERAYAVVGKVLSINLLDFLS